MRYILDDLGYIEEVSFNALIECNNKTCTEYTGSIPSGYNSLDEWLSNSNIRAFFIEDGNLVYDADRDAILQAQYESELGLTDNHINFCNGLLRIEGGYESITTSENVVESLNITFDTPFSKVPIIVVSPENDSTYFYISDKSVTSFKINVLGTGNKEINFNWMATGKQ